MLWYVLAIPKQPLNMTTVWQCTSFLKVLYDLGWDHHTIVIQISQCTSCQIVLNLSIYWVFILSLPCKEDFLTRLDRTKLINTYKPVVMSCTSDTIWPHICTCTDIWQKPQLYNSRPSTATSREFDHSIYRRPTLPEMLCMCDKPLNWWLVFL